jgi:endoglucanase
MQSLVRSLSPRVAMGWWIALALGSSACVGRNTPDEPSAELPPLPLRTSGRWIVDAEGQRVKLAGVNWYGAESADFVPDGLRYNDLRRIARLIRELGFNSVRLPWCNEMVRKDPVVDDAMVSANPELRGKTVMEVFDAVVNALAREGLLIVLDNHRSRGDWCCDTDHGDGLWYTEEYPEDVFVAHWEEMARRYRNQPAVIGADLRNEPRAQFVPGVPEACTDCDRPGPECVCEWASWGDSTGNNRDWTVAAERAGNAALAVNPNWLIIVEGPHWASWLGADYRPIVLDQPNRVVYSVHSYQMMNAFTGDCPLYKEKLRDTWGKILIGDRGPVWVGEFGVSNTAHDNPWWACLREYMLELDVDWAYWALNGTQGKGYSRTDGAVEGYGVLNPTWTAAAQPVHLQHLQELQPTQLRP